MSYFGYITQLKNVRPHPNADRMKLADCFGNTVCVGLDAYEGEIVIYFPVDGQLSEEYCAYNNLVRKKDDAGNNIGGYLDPDKRNIKAIKLRGEKSDGITMPLSSLAYCYDEVQKPDAAVVNLSVGDRIDVVNGHEICKKYIPRTNKRNGNLTEGNRTRKKKAPIAPTFSEHADTEQLAYNLGAFHEGDEIEITLKMHGTSQRTGYLPVLKEWRNINPLWDRVLRYVNPNKPMGKLTEKLYNKALRDAIPTYDWGYVSGTRRTVLENYEGGYYGSNEFREQHSKAFEGRLWKGETVYYEVVGFTTSGAPIMNSCSNKKTKDEEFIKKYGDETVFSYGCSPDGYTDTNYVVSGEPQSALYVYRMTMTNEDGDVVEYTPDFMRYRCEQMGIETVPVLWRGRIPENPGTANDPTITPGEWITKVAEQYYDGPDPIGETHVREGVVVRILNRPKFCAYKHKNWYFKVLEGIIKDSADAPDMEEAQEVDA